MQLVSRPLTKQECRSLQKTYGNYVKVTVDIDKKILIAGCELHADGEKILLESGSLQDNIWGGGINLTTKEIDATAVLNLRPNLQNNSLEVLDPQRRQKLIEVVQKMFSNLWN